MMRRCIEALPVVLRSALVESGFTTAGQFASMDDLPREEIAAWARELCEKDVDDDWVDSLQKVVSEARPMMIMG